MSLRPALPPEPAQLEALAAQLRALVAGDVLVRPAAQEAAAAAAAAPASASAPPEAGQPQQKTDVAAERFASHTRLFNCAALPSCFLVVCPRHTADVVAVVNFCREHHLSPSIKSGGFSTAGWSTSGDVLVDMSGLSRISLTHPDEYVFGQLSSATSSAPALRSSKNDANSRRRKAEEAFDSPSPSASASKRRSSPDPCDVAESSARSNAGGHVSRSGSSAGSSSSGALASAVEQAENGTLSSASGSTGAGAGSTAGTSIHSRASGSPSEAKTDSLPAPAPALRPTLRHGANPAYVFEHERWQRHHNPPDSPSSCGNNGGSSARVQLPTSGGFTWREGQGMTSSPLPWDGSSLAGGSSGASCDAPGMPHSGASPALGHLSLAQEAAMGGQRRPKQTLAPGIYTKRALYASFGPGVGIRELDAYTSEAGKAFGAASDSKAKEKGWNNGDEGAPYFVPASAYPVGSTSMTTGGFGFLTRAYGLSFDNIVELELVTADGEVHVINESSTARGGVEADLWWAARGAAPCLGVVTRITAKAYPVSSVFSGNLILPFSPSTAPSLIQHWRDVLKGDVPRELYANLILTSGPDSRSHVVVIQLAWLGARNDGETFVQALSAWSGERVLLKDVQEKSFLDQQQTVAQVLRGGEGRRWSVRAGLIEALTDELIASTVHNFVALQTHARAVLILELAGGAVRDGSAPNANAGCLGNENREAHFAIAALQQWDNKTEDSRCAASADGWTNTRLGPYPSFLERESRQRVAATFGRENLERLLEVKRRVDPQGLFKHNFLGSATSDEPQPLPNTSVEHATPSQQAEAGRS